MKFGFAILGLSLLCACAAAGGEPTGCVTPDDCGNNLACVNGQCVRVDGGTADSTTRDTSADTASGRDASQGTMCGEACDTGNPCEMGTIDCTGDRPECVAAGPASAGTVCREAIDTCDAEEVCDGDSTMCPADAMRSSGEVCREANGECDPAETCDGETLGCPEDVFEEPGTECAAGVCNELGSCVGTLCGQSCDTGNPCQVGIYSCASGMAVCESTGPAEAGIECRPTTGACDVAESCNGMTETCPPDQRAAAGTSCRPADGECDTAEVCDGSTPSCPIDLQAAPGTMCGGGLDGLNCDGRGECVNVLCGTPCGTGRACELGIFDCSSGSPVCVASSPVRAGVQCRPSLGACDPEEVCNGTSPDCPADVRTPGGTVCRASTGTCDPAETCDGSGASCPSDSFIPRGTECFAGFCDGAGVCTSCIQDLPCTPDNVCAATGRWECAGTPRCVPTSNRADGTTCGSAIIGTFGACNYGGICGQTATRQRTDQLLQCVSGSCVTVPNVVTASCATRNTNGTICRSDDSEECFCNRGTCSFCEGVGD